MSKPPIRVADEVFSRREGSDIAVEFRAGPTAGGGAVITFRDVTEHKRLEERFRQSQKMEPVGRLASSTRLLTIRARRSARGDGRRRRTGSPLR